MRGMLLVLSGPPGVGKDTVIEILTRTTSFSRFPGYTTRPPREHEINGLHYRFLSDSEFSQEEPDLMGVVSLGGYRYGIPITEIKHGLGQGANIVIQPIVQTAELVKEAIPEAVLIFLTPPNLEVLEERLLKRGGAPEETRARLTDSQLMAEPSPSYEYTVCNREGEAELAAKEISNYLRLRRKNGVWAT